MKSLLILFLALFASLGLTGPSGQDFASLRAEGERQFERKSYRLARRSYQRAAGLKLSEADQRWVDFRLADTRWRAAAASDNPDATEVEAAKAELEEQLRGWKRVEERDGTWAEIQESLGDWHWMRRNSHSWGGWNHYQPALEHWAASTELDHARQKYLGIFWKLVEPAHVQPHRRRYQVRNVTEEVLQGAVRIAERSEDIARANYYLAVAGKGDGGNQHVHRRTRDAFLAALAVGPRNEVYDDALYEYGVWLEERGALMSDAERGTWTEPDYVAALAILRRFEEEFERGESQYLDNVRSRIKKIVGEEVALSVGQVFLPTSELQFHLRWRNVEEVQLSLYSVDLTRAVELREKENSQNAWLDTVDLARQDAVARWSFATGDDGRHRWGNKNLPIERELASGAYVLQARGGGAASRELVLVSDAALVLKAHRSDLFAWFADVKSGEPIRGATVRVFERGRSDVAWRDHRLKTDEEGVANFDFSFLASGRRSYFVAASDGARQAFALVGEPWRYQSTDQWKLYAFTDRAAFRPGQSVSWKVQARRQRNARYETPAGEKLHYHLVGPTGEVHYKGEFTLNDFGSGWASCEPEEGWPLGAYQVRFYDSNQKGEAGGLLGGEQLFRLEEYKLPEFLVGVEPATDEEGKPRRFWPGDLVEATVTADYYFGGGVSEATVEVLVYQRQFWHHRPKERAFPWFHEASNPNPWYWGRGEIIHRETLKTDAAGRAALRFATPQNSQVDYEYTIEARVTDSSRREVSGSGSVRVTRQGWFAYLEADHQLYRPRNRAEVELHVLDANDQPVQVEGEAVLLRRVWREVWIDPQGREVRGDVLEATRRRLTVFPPPTAKGLPPWRVHSRGYEDQRVTSTRLSTDEEGRARWQVALPREGYYIVRFASADDRGLPVLTEVPIWCADEASSDLGFFSDSVQLVLDEDTFREGKPSAVMITMPVSDRWVLFTVETDQLLEYRVVHLNGLVKLQSVDVDARWVPNVFLQAVGFVDARATRIVREVIVPPVDHFLDVKLALEPEESLPGETGAIAVEIRDHTGEPVSAEVALSLVDASVSAIQEEYALDPRQFFYGSKRGHAVQTRSTTDERSYSKLVEDEDGRLVDERYAWASRDENEESGRPSLSKVTQGLEDLAALGYSGEGKKAMRMRSPSGPPTAGFFAGGSDDFFLGKEAGAPPSGGVAGNQDPGEAGSEVHVEVRKDFRETAVWTPDLVTGADGKARVEFTYPDTLTTWKAAARAGSRDADFGIARGESATRLPLLVRLQAPRFFVVGDEVVVSLNLDNRTDEAMDVRGALAVEGLEVLGFLDGGALQREAPETISIPAQGGVRLDWRVAVREVGTARFIAKATGPEYGDAVEKELPIYPHGIESLLVKAGRFDGNGVDLVLDLPAARGAGSTAFEVQVTPSLAVTMLDALPYLVSYPYGCTEQTLSRFVPAAIVRRTLEHFGLPAEEGLARVFGGIEPEFAGKTQRKPDASLEELDRVIAQSLERLYDLQHSDGSWSWWKHGDGDPFMTAYVVWGLALAEEAGVTVDRAKLDAGGRWLGEELVEAEKRPDLQAWMLNAHAKWLRGVGDPGQKKFAVKAFQNLMKQRAGLNAYGRALLALSAVSLGRDDDARLLAENLIDGAIRDDAPDASIIPVGGAAGGTQSPRAHWGEDGVAWYRWSDGGVEATAFALKALLAIDPEHELVEPAADWLVANRRGAQWSNTKTTAIVVLALDDYLRKTGQLARSIGYTVAVNGTEIANRELEGTELIAGPATFPVPAELIRNGENRVEIRRTSGEGPLFFSARASFFSEEEPIPPRGNELFVRRQYFRLVARPTLLKGFVYERVPLEDGDSLVSGERVEVVLTVEAKNHLEYLLFEDLKPAGLEATQLKSGESLQARELRRDEAGHRFGDREETRSGRGNRSTRERFGAGYTGRSRAVHQELRDRKVAIFLDQCPEGVWELRYDLRAEAPGQFHALPLLGEAMYVPEIRANGAEIRITVEDREDL